MTIRIRVDPGNPGQYFACCGLLEVADRMWGGAKGRFSEFGDEFFIEADSPGAGRDADGLIRGIVFGEMRSSMQSDLPRLKILKNKGEDRMNAVEKDEYRELQAMWQAESIEVRAGDGPGFSVRWWTDDLSGGSRLKTWAGKQMVSDIVEGLKAKLVESFSGLADPADWLRRSVSKCLPFFFDSDAGSQSKPLDAGFGAFSVGMESTQRPLLEIGAFVGLQRCRPSYDRKTRLYRYVVWTEGLSPTLAAAVCGGSVTSPDSLTYQFPLLFRTKYLKSFLPASRVAQGVSFQ